MRFFVVARNSDAKFFSLSGLAWFVLGVAMVTVASIAWAAPSAVYGSDLDTGDPCSGVPKATESAKSLVHDEIVHKTLECLARVRTRVQMVDRALEAYRRYAWDEAYPEMQLSAASDEALRVALQQAIPVWVERELQVSELKGQPPLPLRTYFTQGQLKEMVALGTRYRQALAAFERDVVRAMAPRWPSFERVEKSLTQLTPQRRARTRLSWLLALYHAHQSRVPVSDWLKTVELISALGGLVPAQALPGVTADLVSSFVAYLAIPALAGGASGDEYLPDLLSEMGESEQPLRAASIALSRMAGPDAENTRLKQRYLALRQTEKTLPRYYSAEHSEPVTRIYPVRVAFMDSGVDPRFFDGNKQWLNPGARGRVFQGDFADNDATPWVPAESDDQISLRHGTQTLSVFQSVLQKWNASLLDPEYVDVGAWKVLSTRQALIANSWGRGLWNAQHVPFRAIRSAVSAEVPLFEQPQVVSVSMFFPLAEQMELAHTPRLLLDAPWLWVMASGNNGRDVSEWGIASRTTSDASQGPSCFDDVPEEQRSDARILCVGGVIRGAGGGLAIASYSNTGKRVDLYASVEQNDYCYRGTSCAVPAITAAATALLAKYPQLTPEQVKRILVDVSLRKTLPICDEEGRCLAGGQRQRILFFEPRTCLPRAMVRAKELLSGVAPAMVPVLRPLR